MDDAEGVRAFHESAPTVQMPTYEFNASMMSRLLPPGGTSSISVPGPASSRLTWPPGAPT